MSTRSTFRQATRCLLLAFCQSCAEGAGSSNAMGGAEGDLSASIEIRDLRAEDITASSATIRFLTNIETTCEVEYGSAPGSLDKRATDPEMDPDNPYDVTHNVPLYDLPSSGVIYYRARAESPSGDVVFSDVLSFQTEDQGEDSPFENWENVALLLAGAEITGVSSNYGNAENDEIFGADFAIDGQLGTEWASAGDGNNAWIELDLGQTRLISGLSFRSRAMSDGSSIIKSFELLLNDDLTLGPFLTPDPSIDYEFVLDSTAQARIIRLSAIETSGGNTGIKEFGLFAPRD